MKKTISLGKVFRNLIFFILTNQNCPNLDRPMRTVDSENQSKACSMGHWVLLSKRCQRIYIAQYLLMDRQTPTQKGSFQTFFRKIFFDFFLWFLFLVFCGFLTICLEKLEIEKKNFRKNIWNQSKWPNNQCNWCKTFSNWHWELALACSYGLHWWIWWLWNIESWVHGFDSYQKLDFNISKMLHIYGLRYATSWLWPKQKQNRYWKAKSWLRRFIFFARNWSWTITSVYSSSGSFSKIVDFISRIVTPEHYRSTKRSCQDLAKILPWSCQDRAKIIPGSWS